MIVKMENVKQDEFEDRYSFHNWFMITSIVGCDITDKMKEYPHIVTMQVNGEEVDPIRALHRLDNSIDDHVAHQAKNLIEDHINDIIKPFEDTIADLTDELHKLIAVKIKEVIDTEPKL